MLSEEIVLQLLEIKSETKNLEYKESLHWEKCSNDEKYGIIKDILAMANTQDGGRLLFGITNNDYNFVGMTEEDFNSFDPTKVNDFLWKYTDPKFTCEVYKLKLEKKEGKRIVAIDVREFQEIPIICKKDAHSSTDNSKQILRKGQIYIRTDKASSESIPSSEEMREFINRAITKKSDDLLKNIERLIKGKPSISSVESEQKYKDEIVEAEKFFIGKKVFNKRSEEIKYHGYWQVISYPADYKLERIQNHGEIKHLINHSIVKLTGWDFPHIDANDNVKNFEKCVRFFTSKFSIEGFSAYQSGLFVWRQAIWEDVHGYTDKGQKVLSYPGAIQLITMYYLFFKRYYEEIAPDSTMHIKILLDGTEGRKLVINDKSPIPQELPLYEAEVRRIPFETNVKLVELKTSYQELARKAIKKIFAMFNRDNISDEKIIRWQNDLLGEVK